MRDGGWYWIDKKVLHLYGRKIKASGIAVYNALSSFADSQTQQCFPTHKGIAQLLGLSRRTVIRKIKLLEQLGLIRLKRVKGRCFYFLLEPGPGVTKEMQGCDKGDTTSVTRGNTNNNQLTRIINNIDIGNKYFKGFKTYRAFKPETREELLALDLAEALYDMDGLPLYLSYARKYPEGFLRQVLGKVLEIPSDRIKKSRGVVFNYLVKKYTQRVYIKDIK